MTDGLRDKYCPYDHILWHGSARAGTVRISSCVRLDGIPSSLLKLFQVYSYLRENQKNHNLSTWKLFVGTFSIHITQGNVAIIDPILQDWISNSKHSCGKHCLFTHQLLMMNFISWVMPELRIHLHFRYLFCFNIGQPGTCIAPQWQFIKVIDSIVLCLPPPLQEQKAMVSFTWTRCDAMWKGTGRNVRFI